MGTRKNRKSKKANKRFRKTRSKKQRGGSPLSLIHKLLDGAKNNNLTKVREALDEGVNMNARNGNRDTALIIASAEGNANIVELLLMRAEARPALEPTIINAKNNNGYTALIRASWKGHTKIVEMLLDAGVDVDAKKNDRDDHKHKRLFTRR